MSAMAINNGVGGGLAAPWSYLGYKGGSELGVVAMSLLGQRKSDGKWFVVTASWNNPDAAVPHETLAGRVTRFGRMSVVWGKVVSARTALGGHLSITKKTT